jgi:hypothetical protein
MTLAPAGSGRNNRYIPCVCRHTGQPGPSVPAGKAVMNTTTHLNNPAATAARPARRADAGLVRLSQRDIDGLLLCEEHYGAPSDLLAAALRVALDRLPAITARWRRAGYAATGPAGPGPGVVLADPGRDDRDRARVPGHPALAGPARPYPGDPGRPATGKHQLKLGRPRALAPVCEHPRRGISPGTKTSSPSSTRPYATGSSAAGHPPRQTCRPCPPSTGRPACGAVRPHRFRPCLYRTDRGSSP